MVSLSLRLWVFHPLTRTYVRLLGPCFKTGRLRAIPSASLGACERTPQWMHPVDDTASCVRLARLTQTRPCPSLEASPTNPLQHGEDRTQGVSPDEASRTQPATSLLAHSTLSPLMLTGPDQSAPRPKTTVPRSDGHHETARRPVRHPPFRVDLTGHRTGSNRFPFNNFKHF